MNGQHYVRQLVAVWDMINQYDMIMIINIIDYIYAFINNEQTGYSFSSFRQYSEPFEMNIFL
jgi:hypothetical protein